MATLLHIMPHRKSAIMIKKVWPGWLKILDTLEFTADTVYYGGIFLKHHLEWLWQQCVHIPHQIIRDHIWNVCYVVVKNVQLLIYQVQNLISTVPMSVQQYVFVYINTFYSVTCMADSLSTEINSVNCLRRPPIQL